MLTPERLDIIQRALKKAKYSGLYDNVHPPPILGAGAHTRRALSSTVINSHQEAVSGQACSPLDPH